MKFTWKWLLDHLETDRNLSEILETLPKLGLEVASIVNLAEDLDLGRKFNWVMR